MSGKQYSKINILILGFVLLTMLPLQARDDQQYWSWYLFNLYQRPKFKVSTYAEFRLQNNLNQPKLTLISPKVYFPVNKNLTFVTSYTYMNVLRAAPIADDEYRYQHRIELEANPSFAITKWLKFKNRNRLEVRWLEGFDGPRNRSRNRVELEVKTPGRGFIKGLYANSEFFIDLKANQYNQNQFIPIGLITQVKPNIKFRIYYMQQYLRTGLDWRANQVIGTFLILNF